MDPVNRVAATAHRIAATTTNPHTTVTGGVGMRVMAVILPEMRAEAVVTTVIAGRTTAMARAPTMTVDKVTATVGADARTARGMVILRTGTHRPATRGATAEMTLVMMIGTVEAGGTTIPAMEVPQAPTGMIDPVTLVVVMIMIAGTITIAAVVAKTTPATAVVIVLRTAMTALGTLVDMAQVATTRTTAVATDPLVAMGPPTRMTMMSTSPAPEAVS